MRAFLGLCLLVGLGCSKAIFPAADLSLPAEVATPERMTLYSILPSQWRQDGECPEELFHRHRVLGKTEVTDPALRRQVFGVVYRGAVRGYSDNFPKCWEPRHGVRVLKGSVSEDYLLCFECGMMTQEPHTEAGFMGLYKGAVGDFDRVLEEAGVPLAPRR